MDFSKLLASIESVTAKKTFDNGDNENYWRMTKDKAGNASAVIRFLPSKNIDDIPFVRLYTHSFKDPSTNRWYIENSLTTIGGQDAVGIANSEAWQTGTEEGKELSRSRKRKLNFISNILVVKDDEAPENVGKVLKFRFGQKIFQKIVAAAKPDESLGEEPVNVYDPELGADFLIKQTIVAGYPNYDQSRFGPKKAITGGQKRIQEVLDQCFDINLDVAPDKFKTPEELAKKFAWVTGAAETKKAAQDYDEELEELTKAAAQPVTTKPKKSPPIPVATAEDSDDDAAFFRDLVAS